jgi:hypothetical protein
MLLFWSLFEKENTEIGQTGIACEKTDFLCPPSAGSPVFFHTAEIGRAHV